MQTSTSGSDWFLAWKHQRSRQTRSSIVLCMLSTTRLIHWQCDGSLWRLPQGCSSTMRQFKSGVRRLFWTLVLRQCMQRKLQEEANHRWIASQTLTSHECTSWKSSSSSSSCCRCCKRKRFKIISIQKVYHIFMNVMNQPSWFVTAIYHFFRSFSKNHLFSSKYYLSSWFTSVLLYNSYYSIFFLFCSLSVYARQFFSSFFYFLTYQWEAVLSRCLYFVRAVYMQITVPCFL